MEKYKSLKKLFHQSFDLWKAEYYRRFTNKNTIHFPLSIANNPCFMELTPEIHQLMESIMAENAKISARFMELGDHSDLLKDGLLREIKMSNAIECIPCNLNELAVLWEDSTSCMVCFQVRFMPTKTLSAANHTLLDLQPI